jgi:hypothetical protein
MLCLVMSDDKPPSAFEDVRKGLGLLFRAARTTAKKLPTKDLEDVVMTSAREVGRAIENVGRRIENEVLGRRPDDTPSSPGEGNDKPGSSSDPKPPEGPKPPDAA